MSPRFRLLLTLACLLASAALPTPTRAQLPRQGTTVPGLVVNPEQAPGLGPGRAYQAEDWELWWYLNREMVLRMPEAWRRAPNSTWQAPSPDELAATLAALVPALEDPDPGVRAAVAHALARAAQPDARARLEQLCQDRNQEVRWSALLALGVLGLPEAAPFLWQWLEEDEGSDEEQFHAAVALGLLPHADVHQAIGRALDPKRFQRLSTGAGRGLALAVGLTGAADLLQPVRDLLKNKRASSAVVRAYLAESLGHLGNPEARKDLVKLMQDDEVLVRRSAALGFGALLAGQEDARAAELLGRLLEKEGEATTRNFQCIALGRIGGPMAGHVLLTQYLTAGRSGLTRGTLVMPRLSLGEQSLGPFAAMGLGMMGAGSRELLQGFRKESKHQYKGALALAAAMTGDAGTVPVFQKELGEQKDPELQAHLQLALGVLRDTSTAPTWLQVLKEERDRRLLWSATVALGLCGAGAAAQEALLARLEEGSEAATQRTLLYCLGLIGDRRALEPVRQLLAGERTPVEVRVYAATALGAILDPAPVRAMALVNSSHNYTVQPELFVSLRATL